MAPDHVVPKLRILKLVGHPKFRTLCRHEMTWPCLEQIKVLQCDRLRRLPLAKQNTDTIKEIKGDLQWWFALEWDDEETKLSMLP